MFIRRTAIAATACALCAGSTHGLMSIHVTHDDALLPGWVVNTFTADSDKDIFGLAAHSHIWQGSILNDPADYPFVLSSGPGDSYVSINNNPQTNASLGGGDAGGQKTPIFDNTEIDLTWYSLSTTDFGLGIHLATLTFSDDTIASLSIRLFRGGEEFGYDRVFQVINGVASYDPRYNGIQPPYIPNPDPNPIDPNPDPDPGGGTGGNPYPNGEPIPEPVWLGFLAASAALIGGLHRRRLWWHHV